jgi:hypothetical protein
VEIGQFTSTQRGAPVRLSPKPHERLKRAHIRAQGASSHTRKHRADEAPLGTTADAFYQKGSGVKSLLKLLDSVPEPGSILPKQPMVPPPIWIQRNGRSASGGAQVTIACPECLRTFLQAVDGSICKILETACVHCSALILYGIVEPFGWVPLEA